MVLDGSPGRTGGLRDISYLLTRGTWTDQSVHFTQKALIVFLLKDSSSNFIKQGGISSVGPKVKLQSRCIAVEKKPLWEAAVTVSAHGRGLRATQFHVL